MKQNSLVQIDKSPNDDRQYLGFELQNGIKVMVISDNHAEKSAASLDVQVGQLQDPEEYQGLAHFCEHMLFMGTEKYPLQNEYSQYLSQNGGSDNAYTDILNTNYYFDVKSDAFEEALDRFSQFFISPLFDETCVEKEINAIENEHQMNVSEDSSRLWGIFKALAKEGTKFRQYGGGCLQTLQKENIREELLKFYEKHYSAHKMNLVIYGQESIEVLKNLAIKYFSSIKNKEEQQISDEQLKEMELEKMHPFPREQLCKLVKIIPIKDEDTIEFCWVVEDQQQYSNVKPDDYLTHIFGHEGKNSLLSLLLDEGLAVELTSYSENCMNLFTIIGFNITLTQRGFFEYKRVCHAVFNYIQILKKEIANKEAYEEVKDIEAINFRFLEKIAISEYVTKIADGLHWIPMTSVLKMRYDFQKYDEIIIQKLIDSLTLDNIIIYLSSKSFDSQFSKSFNTSQQDLDTVIDSSQALTKKAQQLIETHCHNHQITHPHGSAAAQKVKKDKELIQEDQASSYDTDQNQLESHGGESPKLKSPQISARKYSKSVAKKSYTIEEELEDFDDDNHIYNMLNRKYSYLSQKSETNDGDEEYQDNRSDENFNYANVKQNNSKSDDDSFITEKYLGARYLVSEIPEDIKQSYNTEYKPLYSKKKLALPVKNLFIPKNFDILPKPNPDTNNFSKYPIKLFESEMSELYYKQDDTFFICKTYCDLFIFTNDCNQSKTAKSFVLQEIWLILFENYVNETKYLAQMANIDLKFEQHYTSFKVRIKGYSDKIGVLFEEFLTLFKSFNPAEEGQRLFATFYERQMSDYDNYYRDAPHSIITDLSKNCLLSTGKFTIKQKIMALKEIRLYDIVEFHKQWLSHTRLESLIMGNISKEEAISWIQKAENTMQTLRSTFGILKKSEIPLIRPNKILPNTTSKLDFLINEKEFNPEETNSCLQSHYQRGPESVESRVMMKLIQNYLSEPLFNQLRTNEKLGYIVWCWDETFRGVSGFSFLVQSSVCSPMHIQNRLEEFLINMRSELRQLSQEKFENMKHSILIKLTEKPKTLHREFLSMSEEILLHKFVFDRKERIPHILDAITIDDLIKDFDNLFFEQKKKLEIHIITNDHKEEQEQLEQERLKQEDIFILQDDTHLKQFCQQNNSLYYDYSSPVQLQS
ncbi:hypothetical protein ABPG74_008875 [Tetrahymena malaccensis]